MRKTCTFIMLLAVLFSLCCSTVTASESERDMVYVSNSERESIYQATQKESFDCYLMLEKYGFQIVKETITPVYTVDMIDCAKTGIVTVKPMRGRSSDDENSPGNVYVAKTVMSDNTYAGNVLFYIENGVAKGMNILPSKNVPEDFPGANNPYFEASSSYADHAQRIKQILNREDIVSPYDVRYVFIGYVGKFFCVTIGDEQLFIPVGYEYPDVSYAVDSVPTAVDSVLTVSDIKEHAQIQYDAYNKFIARKEAWEKANPGKVYDVVGYEHGTPVLSRCSHVDNILNIPEYLGIDMSTTKQDDTLNYMQIMIGAMVAICVIFIGWIVVVRLKKQRQTNTITEK